MKIGSFFLSIIIFSLTCHTSLIADTSIQILLVGNYHGNEISTDSPSGWWAICNSNGVNCLKTVELRITPVQGLKGAKGGRC